MLLAAAPLAAAGVGMSAGPARALVQDGRSSALTRRIDIGGFALQLTCAGEGAPIVVIDGGAGTWSLHYRHLLDTLAGSTRACIYDRAGLGSSDASPGPRTAENMAEELHQLLQAAQEAGPYVLVGHSLGGYNTRLFAHRHPGLVAGVVLLESGHEAQFERLPAEVGAAIAQAGPQFRALAEMARGGRLPEQPAPPLPAFDAHPELRTSYAEAVKRPEHWEAMAGEMERAPESAAQVRAAKPLGETPLVVVTAGRSFAIYEPLGIPFEPANRIWLELQSELLDLSTDATQLLAPDATHQIDVEAPELVVNAIERVVRAARRGTRLSASPGPDGHGRGLFDRWEAYLAMINQESLAELVELFAADAVLMPPNQPTVHGRGGAREWFGALFGNFDIELLMPTLELQVLGDRALRRGSYEVTLTPAVGGPPVTDRGKFLQVWERQADGAWRIVRGMLNSDLPPAAAGTGG